MNNSDSSGGGGFRRSMTETEEMERRASIQAIMKDPNLTPLERRKSIQSLMDGRRRSSTAARRQSNGVNGDSSGGKSAPGVGMAAAAAMAAADFDDLSDSDEDDDDDDNDNVDDEGEDHKVGIPMADSNGTPKREAKKRSSFMFKRGSSQNIATKDGRSGRRRASLRDSFTSGFSKMGVKGSLTSGGAVAGVGGDPRQPSSLRRSFGSNLAPQADPNAFSRKLEKSRPPCGHYERNCSIVSPCCGLVFGCRICHNDAPELPPPFLLMGGAGQHTMEDAGVGFAAAAAPRAPMLSHRSASLPSNFEEEESHHEIDRFLIKEVICRECFTRQSSKTRNNCINCSIQFGTYHCSTCNLWMSADEEPYHCLKCGFCRVGGRENFSHCDDCGMCIDALLFEDHNCKSGKYMSNCPVCQEDLFSSRMASHEMPCGHAIHWHCFRELTSHDTRCPVCKKTAETHDQMEQTWNAMAMGIALQPVPPDMARVVDILCNDCEAKGVNQRWHFLGVQCRRCTSFNTTVERTVLVGQEAADFLGPTADIAAQAQWASGMADQNVLSALMGGGLPAAGLAAAGDGSTMDTEALTQSVAADVMGIMNRNNQQFSNRMDDGDEMDQMDQS